MTHPPPGSRPTLAGPRSGHASSDAVATTVPVAILADPSSAANGRFAVTAWLIAFAGIVVLAAAGRLVSGAPEARTAAAIASPPATALRPAPALVTLPEIIVLANPAVANATVTTRELHVRGYLRSGGGTIRVTLEARGNRIIDEATITPTPTAGAPRAIGRQARFETRFGLPNPRPNGRMILQVALLDDEGRLVDVIRRPFRVGPLLEGAGG
jgi:hypothetical protein